jgi:excisionase family DNA binding protein
MRYDKPNDQDSDPDMTESRGVPIDQAAKTIGKSRKTILRWIQSGKIPAHKVQVDGHEQWRVDLDGVLPVEQVVTGTNALKDLLAEKDRRIVDLLAEISTLKTELADINERLREAHILIGQQEGKLKALPGPRKWWQFWKR